MFTTRFFCARYFAPRYWPKIGDTAQGVVARIVIVPRADRTFAVSVADRTFVVPEEG